MSNIQAVVYTDAVAVTVSDTTADPAGPFASLLCTVAGTLKISTIRQPNSSVSLVVVAGQVIPIVTQRVWSTGTSSTVVGLTALPFKGAPVQGP